VNLLSHSHCPLCHSTDFDTDFAGTIPPGELRPADFRITDNRYGFRWQMSRCRHCRFVFSNPYLPAEQLETFYSALIDPEYSAEAAGRSRNFITLLKRLESLHPPGRRLLDVGAASGIFLNEARRVGYDIAGIEPSAFLVAEARRLYGIGLFCGTSEQFPFTGSYDIVTLLDIIEHLQDPSHFLERISSHMTPGGVLLIVTPDIDSLAARLSGRRWWHYRLAHINFFNLTSLRYLLEQHGFSIITCKRYAWNFSVHYLLTRIFPAVDRFPALQKVAKQVNFKLQLFDSWEIYARKGKV
jgi:2-polyprenyl-3-methyl-5-hydroxy-6-metoxy-1,4-benzoquinol methylase